MVAAETPSQVSRDGRSSPELGDWALATATIRREGREDDSINPRPQELKILNRTAREVVDEQGLIVIILYLPTFFFFFFFSKHSIA